LPEQDFVKKTVRNCAGLSTVWLIHNPRSSEAGTVRKRHASVRRALNWPSKGGFPMPVPGAHTLKSEHGYLLTILTGQIHSHLYQRALVIAVKRTPPAPEVPRHRTTALPRAYEAWWQLRGMQPSLFSVLLLNTAPRQSHSGPRRTSAAPGIFAGGQVMHHYILSTAWEVKNIRQG
jgi:hypothetical protein